MSIRIVEYAESMIPEVRAFNARLLRGGLAIQFHENCLPHGFAKADGQRLYEEHFLALEGDVVRGGYGLKHQDFWIGGRAAPIADFWLPISEGAIKKTYATLAPALLLDALRRQPLLYGLGMGGYDEAVVRLLVASRWRISTVPFFFRVVHGPPFFRNIAHLRRGRLQSWTFDALAATGLGSLAVMTIQRLRRPPAMPDQAVVAEVVPDFAEWVDALWNARKQDYGFSAVRDLATLRILYPPDQPRFIRLKISRRHECIGWAVLLDTRLSDHKQFGNMHLGSLVDGFASSADARDVAVAARVELERRGVDLIVSNQAHAAWQRGLRAAGFLQGPSNFLFAASPRLAGLLDTAGVRLGDLHLNRGDGDGPVNL